MSSEDEKEGMSNGWPIHSVKRKVCEKKRERLEKEINEPIPRHYFCPRHCPCSPMV